MCVFVCVHSLLPAAVAKACWLFVCVCVCWSPWTAMQLCQQSDLNPPIQPKRHRTPYGVHIQPAPPRWYTHETPSSASERMCARVCRFPEGTIFIETWRGGAHDVCNLIRGATKPRIHVNTIAHIQVCVYYTGRILQSSYDVNIFKTTATMKMRTAAAGIRSDAPVRFAKFF